MNSIPDPPGLQAGDILPIIGIAPAVAMAVAWPLADGALASLVWVGAFAAEALGLGAVIGLVYWLLVVDRRRPLWVSIAFVLGAVTGAAGLAVLIS